MAAITTTTTATSTATATASNQDDFSPSLRPKTKPWNNLNFSSAPTFNLTWGRQRHLRCVKHPDLIDSPPSPSPASSADGIDAVREKLTLDFRAQVNQLKSAFFNGGKTSEVAAAVKNDVSAAATAAENRPWNLRTRRAVCKVPSNNHNNNNLNGHISDRKPSFSPARNGCGDGDREEKRKRVKFAVSLSRREIEEDFLAMAGVRPARRPKKRVKSVQKQIDAMSPGFWLTEITADMYKVNEQPPPDDSKR